MKGIYFSTTKLVLVMMCISLCIFTYLGIVSEENFMMIISGVVGFFFHKQGIENKADMNKRKVDIVKEDDGVTYITYLD